MRKNKNILVMMILVTKAIITDKMGMEKKEQRKAMAKEVGDSHEAHFPDHRRTTGTSRQTQKASLDGSSR